MKDFFINQEQVIFTAKILKFMRRIEYMQKRIKDKIDTRHAKYDLLSYYWDSIIRFMEEQGNKKFDERVKKFARDAL